MGSEIWGEDQQQRRETRRERRPERAAKTWAAPYPSGVGDPLATSQTRPQPSPPEERPGDERDGNSWGLWVVPGPEAGGAAGWSCNPHAPNPAPASPPSPARHQASGLLATTPRNALSIRPHRYLPTIPLYAAWKAPIYPSNSRSSTPIYFRLLPHPNN